MASLFLFLKSTGLSLSECLVPKTVDLRIAFASVLGKRE